VKSDILAAILPKGERAVSTLNADAVIKLVNEVKSAIMAAQQRPGVNNIKVTRVDFVLLMALIRGSELDGKIGPSWLTIPIELSGKISRASTQTITLSLVPEPGGELMGTASSELADAIEVIAKGTEAAAKSPPTFSLTEATASLNIGTTKEGKIVIFFGGEGQSVTTHTVTLTLQQS
jgi:hypothetical protein